MSSIRFRRHALDRLGEHDSKRLSLTLTGREVAAILDANQAVPIGQEHGTNRMHWAFYSVKDDRCFVAVKDEKTGEVVTILPLNFRDNTTDYHRRWRLSGDPEAMARELILGPTPPPPERLPEPIENFSFKIQEQYRVLAEIEGPPRVLPAETPPIFHVTCTFRKPGRKEHQTVPLPSMGTRNHRSPALFMADSEVQGDIRRAIALVCEKQAELVQVTVRLGRSGKAVTFDP